MTVKPWREVLVGAKVDHDEIMALRAELKRVIEENKELKQKLANQDYVFYQ